MELKHLTSEDAKNESASHFKDKETGASNQCVGVCVWGGGGCRSWTGIEEWIMG
jgi:hypothetical protein